MKWNPSKKKHHKAQINRKVSQASKVIKNKGSIGSAHQGIAPQDKGTPTSHSIQIGSKTENY